MVRTEAERIAVLETKQTAMEKQLTSIEEKLDALLELKSKGMGALGLATLIIGAGGIGLITLILNFFNKGHL